MVSRRDFIKAASFAGNAYPIVSAMVLYECAYRIFRNEWELSGKKPKWLVEAHKRNPAILQTLWPEYDSFYQAYIENGGMVVVGAAEINSDANAPELYEEMHRFINAFDMLPADAIHAAIASIIQVDAIATSDQYFQRINGIVDIINF